MTLRNIGYVRSVCVCSIKYCLTTDRKYDKAKAGGP